MKIVSIVGARPNFMKVAPFIRAINEYNEQEALKIKHILVHTGQHYDIRMSQKFFDDLNIPQADIHLGIGSGTHAEQVGKTMIEFEKVLRREIPHWVVVLGDVNAICAGAITAKKENIRLAHIEAGLRSGDISMPEEVNRLVADRLSDLLFTPDRISSENLLKEGVPPEKIKFVGNIMIDTLEHEWEKAKNINIGQLINNNLIKNYNNKVQLNKKDYIIITLHRPTNVDVKDIFVPVLNFIGNVVAKDYTVVWPVHPRAMKQMNEFGVFNSVKDNPRIILLEPLGYHDLLRLNMDARMVITDSGGLQEECTVLGTPCLTLRWNTERPITLRKYNGASLLVGNDITSIEQGYHEALSGNFVPTRPELWDGKTAQRIVTELVSY